MSSSLLRFTHTSPECDINLQAPQNQIKNAQSLRIKMQSNPAVHTPALDLSAVSHIRLFSALQRSRLG